MKIETFPNCTLYQGDAMEILNDIEGDAIITDPPYVIPTQAAQTRKITKTIGDLSLIEHTFRAFLDKTSNAIGSTGRHFIFTDAILYPVLFRAAYGKFTSSLLVWDKKHIGMGREFRKRHELIFHLWNKETPIVSTNGTAVADVLAFNKVPKKDRLHDAEKPVPLLEQLAFFCGNTIIDPFMGSGSTGIAALNTNRKFIGIEIEPTYFDKARRRIEHASLLDCTSGKI